MQSEPVVELVNLTKDYGQTRALNHVNLQVFPGEVFGYIGANGAGKTTTIKILTGLIRPSAGNALVCGYSILDHPIQVKARVGYMPESGALFEKLSPCEYLTLIGQLYALPDQVIDRRVSEWLHFFGLSDRAHLRMGTFSKGTKQKICWIAALLHDPEVLILDEPLNGLDVETVARTKELIKQMAAAGKTIFYSSHLIDIVEKICTRIAVLNKGEIMCVGSINEVRSLAEAPSLEQALLQMWQD